MNDRKNTTVFDELLVFQAQRGDRKAVELLVKRWSNKLLHHIYRHIGKMDPCDDLLQDTWQEIIQGLLNLKDPSKFQVWAYTIASRQAYKWIRNKQKERAHYQEINEVKNALYQEEPGNQDSIQLVRKVIQQLPENQYLILKMYYSDGMSVNEIAKVMEVPKGTVKSRLFHSREMLKRKIKQFNYEI